MLKEIRKKAEISAAIEAYGDVQPGEKHFEEVERLRAQLEAVRAGIRKRIIFRLAAPLVVGAVVAGVSFWSKDKDVKPASIDRPTPDLVSKVPRAKAPGWEEIKSRNDEVMRELTEVYANTHPYLSSSSRFGGYMNQMHKLLANMDGFPDEYLQKMYKFLQFKTRVMSDPIAVGEETQPVMVVYMSKVVDAGEGKDIIAQQREARFRWHKEHQIAFYEEGTLYLPDELPKEGHEFSEAEANLIATSKPFVFAAIHDAMKDVGESDESDDDEFGKIFHTSFVSIVKGGALLHVLKPAANYYGGVLPLKAFIFCMANVVKDERNSLMERFAARPETRKILDIGGKADSRMVEAMIYATVKALAAASPAEKAKLAQFMPLILEVAKNPQWIKVDVDKLTMGEKLQRK